MRHSSIPATYTPEQAAQWIQDNADRTIEHEEKTELTEETKSEFEHKSSLASRAIDRLEEVKEEFMNILKDGTQDPEKPFDITIPPTKGMKILKANRKFADKQIEMGYTSEITTLYFIPNPEESMMVAVDIEGNEWPEHSVEMTEDEHKKYGKLFAKKKDKKVKVEEDAPELDI